MSTDQPHEPDPPHPTRRRTPAQAAAWAKVERERADVAARPGTAGVDPVVVARLVIGVLMAAAALTTFFAMAPDDPYGETRSSARTANDYLDLISAQQEQSDDRRDALLVIGLVGAGAAVATTRAERRTPSTAAGPSSRSVDRPADPV